MTDYVLLEEVVLLPGENEEKPEEKPEENAEEGVEGAFVAVPDAEREHQGEDLTMMWPWIVGGAGIFLALVAALVAIWVKKRGKAGESSTVQKPITEKIVKPTDSVLSVGKLHQMGKRESQQDCFAVSPLEMLNKQGVLAVVADGMGGLKDGDKVSQLVVSTILNGFVSAMGHPQSVLLNLVGQANLQVNRMLGHDVGRSGSTVVAGLVRDGYFHYVSIGDSRISLLRDGQLIQLNREHVYRNDLAIRALNGIGNLQAALLDPKGSGLTSYIGMGQLRYVDIPAQPIKIQPNDKFILMSDGVYNALTAEEMVGALHAAPEQAAEQISQMIEAKAFRGQDNYTAVILGF